jgi:hypothetical protein
LVVADQLAACLDVKSNCASALVRIHHKNVLAICDFILVLYINLDHIWSKRPLELKLGDRLVTYIRLTITKFQLH